MSVSADEFIDQISFSKSIQSKRGHRLRETVNPTAALRQMIDADLHDFPVREKPCDLRFRAGIALGIAETSHHHDAVGEVSLESNFIANSSAPFADH